MIISARTPMRRGMGDAQCPSLQQLQGISDITDPCQSGSLPLLSPGVQAAITSGAITPPVSAPAPSWLWIGGGLLAGFLLLRGLR